MSERPTAPNRCQPLLRIVSKMGRRRENRNPVDGSRPSRMERCAKHKSGRKRAEKETFSDFRTIFAAGMSSCLCFQLGARMSADVASALGLGVR